MPEVIGDEEEAAVTSVFDVKGSNGAPTKQRKGRSRSGQCEFDSGSNEARGPLRRWNMTMKTTTARASTRRIGDDFEHCTRAPGCGVTRHTENKGHSELIKVVAMKLCQRQRREAHRRG